MWQAPNDPQIYGSIDIDATRMLAYVADARARGHKLTVTHLVGRALARAIAAVPDINVRLLAGYAIPRPSVDIFFITAVQGGEDLSGVKVEHADEKSAVEIAAELRARATAMKEGRDPDLAKTKHLMERLPNRLLRMALRASVSLASDLDLSIPALGLSKSPFGSAMVSSVGSFGLPMGFVPIAWMYRVPVLVLVGEVTEKPTVVDGAVAVRPMLPICATIDHRYVDGWHVSKLLKVFREYLAAPEKQEPERSEQRASALHSRPA